LSDGRPVGRSERSDHSHISSCTDSGGHEDTLSDFHSPPICIQPRPFALLRCAKFLCPNRHFLVARGICSHFDLRSLCVTSPPKPSFWDRTETNRTFPLVPISLRFRLLCLRHSNLWSALHPTSSTCDLVILVRKGAVSPRVHQPLGGVVRRQLQRQH
jgi:hypothetical protein